MDVRLFSALQQEDKKKFLFLLEQGANPNFQLKNGESIISLATTQDTFFLEKSLGFGGTPNILNSKNKVFPTPIFRAIAELKIENIKVLISYGADINYSDFRGFTPLLYAANVNQWQIVMLLLENGADYNVIDKWGHGVVYSLEENNISSQGELFAWRQKVIDFLRFHGVSVNPKKAF